MLDEPEHDALFYIEGPDERGCVWVHGTSSADPWTRNLGPAAKVAEVLSQWLGAIDYDEAEMQPTTRKRRAVELPATREHRIQANKQKQREQAGAADDAVDEMVRRNIEDHGP